MTSHPAPTPHLLGDIGGTNARFALLQPATRLITHTITLPTGQFPDLASAAQAYLQQVGQAGVQQACIAIANPIDGDTLKMTNNHWQFSIEATRQQLGLNSLLMLNDWEAMAMAAPVAVAWTAPQVPKIKPLMRVFWKDMAVTSMPTENRPEPKPIKTTPVLNMATDSVGAAKITNANAGKPIKTPKLAKRQACHPEANHLADRPKATNEPIAPNAVSELVLPTLRPNISAP